MKIKVGMKFYSKNRFTKISLLFVFFFIVGIKLSAQPCPVTAPDITVCRNTNSTLNATFAHYYMWSPLAGLSDSTIQNPIVNIPNTKTYTLNAFTEVGPNLVVNPGFESGNINFDTDYNYTAPGGKLFGVKRYAIDNEVLSYNHLFDDCRDHSGTGKMMIVNGDTISGSKVWEQKSIPVKANTWYAFSTFVTSIYDLNPSIIRFRINGDLIGQDYNVPITSCSWKKFHSFWFSGPATTATLSIRDANIIQQGNDFAIDDIKFIELCPAPVDNAIVTVRPDSSVTNITVCSNELPYLWNGTLRPPGRHTYSNEKTKFGGCDSTAILYLTEKLVSPVIVSDITVCRNTNGQLNASNADYYRWSPLAGLSDSTIANPVANVPKTTTYTLTGYTENPTNLIKNGDFELGNKYFDTGYSYKASGSPTFVKGNYAVDTNPIVYNSQFGSCGDRTSASGKMMIVDGDDVIGRKVWGQTITVKPNKYYAFYAYVTSIFPDEPAKIQFTVDGVLLGNVYNVPSTTCSWKPFYAIWYSGSKTLPYLSIVNQNTEITGNDFALDDIKFVELCEAVTNVTVTVRPDSSVTNITVCSNELPYLWNGTPRPTAGRYTYLTKTTVGNCDSTAILYLTEKLVNPVIVSDITVCRNTNGQLNASNADYYRWSPLAGLSDSTIANPVVNVPKTTTYTLTGYTENPTNLIKNGDFELGNQDFNSEYIYNAVSIMSEGTYTVGKSPKTFHSLFSACVDNTSKSGNMLIVNGGTTANTKIWEQKNIVVKPNSYYAFYAYITPVYKDNPPIIQFSIDGIILGKPFVSPANVCGWNRFYAIWYSGSKTTANISIVNQNTIATGNDFAIDDIKYFDLCENVKNVTVTVRPDSSVTNITVCSNELPYLWNGTPRPTAGRYTYLTKTTVGNCDSTAILYLTENPILLGTVEIKSVCSKDLPYRWRLKDYSVTGTYFDTIPNAAGCDSIMRLNLTVNTIYFAPVLNQSVCSKDLPYVWRLKDYSVTGTYFDTITVVGSCDSILTLNLTVKPISFGTVETQSVCSNDLPYTWRLKNYSVTGTYFDTIPNAAGCDSILTLNLTVRSISFAPVQTQSFCSNDLPYTWRLKNYSVTGTYFDTIPNAVGCDSILTLNLTVKPISFGTVETQSVCSNDLPYTWRLKNYSVTGTYFDTIPNAVGCDSILTLNLTVKSSTSETINLVVCDSYTAPDRKVYTVSGIYQAVIANKNECDSTITINLTVNKTSTSIVSDSICEGKLYQYNGENFSDPGTYYVSLRNVISGCDSIVTLVLSQNTGVDTIHVVLFSGETYTVNGEPKSETGLYIDSIKVAGKCDDIVIVDLSFIDIPNTFTPNEDGKNDLFMAGHPVQIYNRNGILLHDGKNTTDGWDGKYNGKTVSKDTYFYVLYYKSDSLTKTKEGYIVAIP